MEKEREKWEKFVGNLHNPHKKEEKENAIIKAHKQERKICQKLIFTKECHQMQLKKA